MTENTKPLNETTETVVVAEEKPEVIVEQYFSDPDVIKKLDDTALHFFGASKGNWTTVSELARKSDIGKDDPNKEQVKTDIKMMLDLLVMSKRAFAKKNKEGVITYKITLTKDGRKKVLENAIAEYNQAIAGLQKELDSLV